jgi:Hemolysin coregulated protein Hcp (TssD)
MPASSFDAYLTWTGGGSPAGDGLPIISCSYSLSQSIDDKGRVSSKVYGGTVFVQVDSSDEAHAKELWEWMIDADGKKPTAKIIFKNIDSGQNQKQLEMTDVYCVQYSENFTESGSSSMTTSLTLSAREMKLHGKGHTNRW